MHTTAQKPATTPIPVQLSAPEFEVCILPHLSMPKRGLKCTLGYCRVFNLILWVLSCGSLLVSYGMMVDVLTDFLPLDVTLDVKTVRHDTLKVAERCEAELGEDQWSCIDGCPRDWGNLPVPRSHSSRTARMRCATFSST
jgi:hypothetical protein